MKFTRFLEKRRKTLLEWLKEEALTDATLEAVEVRVNGLGQGVDQMSAGERLLVQATLAVLAPAVPEEAVEPVPAPVAAPVEEQAPEAPVELSSDLEQDQPKKATKRTAK